MTLAGKTLFISGASRGIGLAIALKAARDGANIAIAAKTADPNAKLPGTIFSAAAEIEKAGGKALAIQCDIRFEDQVAAAQLVCFTLETRPDASRAVCLLHSSNRIGSIRDSRTPMLRVGPPFRRGIIAG